MQFPQKAENNIHWLPIFQVVNVVINISFISEYPCCIPLPYYTIFSNTKNDKSDQRKAWVFHVF